jgi:hypothetical protein
LSGLLGPVSTVMKAAMEDPLLAIAEGGKILVSDVRNVVNNVNTEFAPAVSLLKS